MKIKYRRFDDSDYTEIDDVRDFDYGSNCYGKPELDFYAKGYQDVQTIENVCEVYLEEI